MSKRRPHGKTRPRGRGGLHTTSAAKRHETTAAAEHRALIAMATTTTLDLLDPRGVVELAANEAIELGRLTTAVGVTPLGLAVICVAEHTDCLTLPGAISVVPDIVEAEWAANGLDAPLRLMRVTREDGRSCAVVFSTTQPAGGAW